MAAAQADLGVRVLSRLANASIDFAGQAVFGLLADVPGEAGVGGGQVRVRTKTFTCLVADLQEVTGGVARNRACTLAGDAWVVVGRVDTPATGNAELTLERA